MADETISIDEAVATITSLEKEERRKWHAIQRIKGTLLIAQSLRGKEAVLAERAAKYERDEIDIENNHKKRLCDIENSIKKSEDDHKAYIELLTDERQRVEKESREGIDKAKQAHAAAMAEYETLKKRAYESQVKDVELHNAHLHKMQDEFADTAKALKAEEAALSEKVSKLKAELSKIQNMMLGVLKKGGIVCGLFF